MASGHHVATRGGVDRGRPGRRRRMCAAWGAAVACGAAGASALVLSPATPALPSDQQRPRLAAIVADVGTEGRHEHEGSTQRPRRSIAETLAELRLYDVRGRGPAVDTSQVGRGCPRPAAGAYFWSPPRICSSAAPIRRPAS